jgi:hypothetical protein
MNDPRYHTEISTTNSYDWNAFSSAVPDAAAVASRPTEAPIHQIQPSTRRVQFHEARIVGVVAPISSMSQQQRDELWYTPSALDNFKTQVRSMCRKLRHAPHSEEQHSTAQTSSSRGLEHRVCPKRQRNKQLALRCVLKAQMRSSCPDFLATISSKCTSWARQLAQNEGSRDFAEAYAADNGNSDNVASLVNDRQAKKNPCPLLSKLNLCPAKRARDKREEEQMHVDNGDNDNVASLDNDRQTKKKRCLLSKLNLGPAKRAPDKREEEQRHVDNGNNDNVPLLDNDRHAKKKPCLLSKLNLCPAKRACDKREEEQRQVRRKEY